MTLTATRRRLFINGEWAHASTGAYSIEDYTIVKHVMAKIS